MSAQVLVTICPYCKSKTEGQITCPRPITGDLTICAVCGETAIFNHGTLRLMTQAEIEMAAAQSNIAELTMSWRDAHEARIH